MLLCVLLCCKWHKTLVAAMASFAHRHVWLQSLLSGCKSDGIRMQRASRKQLHNQLPGYASSADQKAYFLPGFKSKKTIQKIPGQFSSWPRAVAVAALKMQERQYAVRMQLASHKELHNQSPVRIKRHVASIALSQKRRSQKKPWPV